MGPKSSIRCLRPHGFLIPHEHEQDEDETKMPSSGAFPGVSVTPASIGASLRRGPPVFWFTDRSLCSMWLHTGRAVLA